MFIEEKELNMHQGTCIGLLVSNHTTSDNYVKMLDPVVQLHRLSEQTMNEKSQMLETNATSAYE